MNKRFNSWATHLPLLATVVARTRGSVLELGPGLYSTPVISQLMAGSGRTYLGVDTDAEWIKAIKVNRWLADPAHMAWTVSDYRANEIWSPEWDDPLGMGRLTRWNVVFLDCFPDSIRYGLLKDMYDGKLKATIIVCHDTSPNMDRRMGLRPLLDKFKFRFCYNRLMPWTDVVSNDVDVNDLVMRA